MSSKAQSSRHKTAANVPSLISFSDEIEYLAVINKKLDVAVQVANDHVEKIDKDYRDAKRYMAD